MGSHKVCTYWMYRYCVLYLAWWWLNEPKHIAEFLILITNIYCCVYWLNKLLYYCKIQRDGSYQNNGGIIKSVLRNFRVLQGISWHTESKLSAAVLQLIYGCWMLNQSDATESGPSEKETLYKSQLVAILVYFEVIDATKARFSKFIIVFYVWVSVNQKSILHKEPTRCNFGSIVY